MVHPRPGARPTSPAWWLARARQAPARRAAHGEHRQDRWAQRKESGPRVRAGRPGGGTEARRRGVDRPGSPPRGRRGGGGDRAAPGSRAWWGRHGPSAGCDGPDRNELRNPGSGSRGRGGAARAVAPGESCASGLRSPPHAPRRRAHHHAAGVARQALGRFRGNARRRPRARTGLGHPGPPGPGHRRGRRPGSARPECQDRSRDGGPSRPAAPERRLAAAPIAGVSAGTSSGRRHRANATSDTGPRARRSRALTSSDPISGSSRPRIVTIPSSS